MIWMASLLMIAGVGNSLLEWRRDRRARHLAFASYIFLICLYFIAFDLNAPPGLQFTLILLTILSVLGLYALPGGRSEERRTEGSGWRSR